MDTCYYSPTCYSLLSRQALNGTASTRWQHSLQSCMKKLSLVKLQSSDTASWTPLIDALALLILTLESIFRTQCCQPNWGVWLMLLGGDLGRTVHCSKAETVLISEESCSAVTKEPSWPTGTSEGSRVPADDSSHYRDTTAHYNEA